MKKRILSLIICAAVAGTMMPDSIAVQAASAFGDVKNVEGVYLTYDLIVDGSFEGEDGNKVNGIPTYKTVQAAVDSISSKNTSEKKIYIKNGTYYEKLNISRPNVTLIGEDPEKTVLTYDVASGCTIKEEHGGDGTATYGTSKSASVSISSKAVNFKAVNVTFENSFDEEANKDMKNKQAVALKNEADRSLFVNCRFLGDQDTLLANKNTTQYYSNCYIEGDVDFIFGSATAIFDECELFSSERNGITPSGYITAPNTEKGRKGYLVINSILTSDVKERGSVYLGRPWHPSSATTEIDSSVAFVNTKMGYHIAKEGWTEMSGEKPENNSMFEYGSTGLGANSDRRQISEEEISEYTIASYLGDWDPSADINKLKSLVEKNVVDLNRNDDQAECDYDMIVDSAFEGNDGDSKYGVSTYKSIQAAIDTISSKNASEKKILIKAGRYYEKLNIEKPNVTLIGEDPENTVITYDVASGSIMKPEHGGDGVMTYGTSKSASVVVAYKAVNFNAVNITFENSFDESLPIQSKQAVALRNEADKSTFVNCRFIGDQDTLLVNKNVTQHYYRCYIEGDVDFIFGSATAVFEECELFSSNRAGISPKGYIVAPSTEKGRYGYLILNSKLSSDVDVDGSVYLGRPWQPSNVTVPMDSMTIFMNTDMGSHISKKGWDSMSGVSPLDNTMFEYGSTGPGAVKYSDSRRKLSDEEAAKFTKEAFMGGWDNSHVIDALSSYVVKEVADLSKHDMSNVELDRAANIVVDGNFEGNNGQIVEGVKTYKTLQSAIDSIPDNNDEEVKVYVKPGIYKEKLVIKKPNVTLIGEDAKNTIITYDVAAGSLKPDGNAYGTSGSASVSIQYSARNFSAVNITFENSFDEKLNSHIKSTQAVAIKNESNNSAFYNCRFISNQDTLYANQNTTQYYYKCYIEGDVDYIFGSATAVFEECELFSVDREGIYPKGYIVAPSTEAGRLGYLILNSKLTSNVKDEGTVYLGRPWWATMAVKLNSSAVFRGCDMGAHISSKGWVSMSGVTPEENTLMEYNNTGAGAIVSETRPQISDEDADKYSREAYLGSFDADGRIADLEKTVEGIKADFKVEIALPEKVETPDDNEVEVPDNNDKVETPDNSEDVETPDNKEEVEVPDNKDEVENPEDKDDKEDSKPIVTVKPAQSIFNKIFNAIKKIFEIIKGRI